MEKYNLMPFKTTSKGEAYLWERGGGKKNSGFARIIAGKDGEKITPLFIYNGEYRKSENHGKIPISPGTVVIEVMWISEIEKPRIFIQQIIELDFYENYLFLKKIGYFINGVWDTPNKKCPKQFKEAVKAGVRKAMDLQCRKLYYASEK
jgi:hypothetical protein